MTATLSFKHKNLFIVINKALYCIQLNSRRSNLYLPLGRRLSFSKFVEHDSRHEALYRTPRSVVEIQPRRSSTSRKVALLSPRCSWNGEVLIKQKRIPAKTLELETRSTAVPAFGASTSHTSSRWTYRTRPKKLQTQFWTSPSPRCRSFSGMRICEARNTLRRYTSLSTAFFVS